MDNDHIVGERDSDIESEDSEGGIVVVADAWPVFPVAVPTRERQYLRTLRKEE